MNKTWRDFPGSDSLETSLEILSMKTYNRNQFLSNCCKDPSIPELNDDRATTSTAAVLPTVVSSVSHTSDGEGSEPVPDRRTASWEGIRAASGRAPRETVGRSTIAPDPSIAPDLGADEADSAPSQPAVTALAQAQGGRHDTSGFLASPSTRQAHVSTPSSRAAMATNTGGAVGVGSNTVDCLIMT